MSKLLSVPSVGLAARHDGIVEEYQQIIQQTRIIVSDLKSGENMDLLDATRTDFHQDKTVNNKGHRQTHLLF